MSWSLRDARSAAGGGALGRIGNSKARREGQVRPSILGELVTPAARRMAAFREGEVLQRAVRVANVVHLGHGDAGCSLTWTCKAVQAGGHRELAGRQAVTLLASALQRGSGRGVHRKAPVSTVCSPFSVPARQHGQPNRHGAARAKPGMTCQTRISGQSFQQAEMARRCHTCFARGSFDEPAPAADPIS